MTEQVHMGQMWWYDKRDGLIYCVMTYGEHYWPMSFTKEQLFEWLRVTDMQIKQALIQHDLHQEFMAAQDAIENPKLFEKIDQHLKGVKNGEP